MSDFFRTRMGHQFFQSTLPRLIDEISKLADGVATLNETLGSRPDAREGVGPRARARILIVDDHEQILRGLARSLKQDHDVLLATSPAVALAMAEAHELAAIVTDHDLADDGGRNGIWLLEQVRDRLPGAHRILMSGGQPAIDDHLKSGLVQRYLPKPVAAAEVLACLGDKPPKLCIKCGTVLTDQQPRGEERCARCGDGP